MSSYKFDVVPNPLATPLHDGISEFFQTVDGICDERFPFDYSFDCGIQSGESGGYRPSTDEELTELEFSFEMKMTCDVRENLVDQITTWLAECLKVVKSARNDIATCKDTRDLDEIRRMLGDVEPAAA